MDWNFWLIVVAVVTAWLVLRRRGQIPVEEARRLLRGGARVIDVRSAAEFAQGHLAGVVNIPLGEISESLPREVPDRSAVLLLHCLSGTRSGIARMRLRSMGYGAVHNLGSYGRAKAILEGVK